VNLEVLELVFAQSGPQPLVAWLRAQPESSYARRAGFLYEWITGKKLDVPELGTRTAYVSAVDESLQFGMGDAAGLDRKFRVRDNLPGAREFCPLVRKTPAILEPGACYSRSMRALPVISSRSFRGRLDSATARPT
jgi:hypothetical protein